MRTLSVALDARSYPIHIGTGLLGDAASYVGLPRASAALLRLAPARWFRLHRPAR